MNVARGQRYRAKREVPVTCMTQWAAPFTGGHEVVLPEGEVIVIAQEPPPTATAVYADPENYRKLHRAMVPLRQRAQFWIYRGYYLCIALSRLQADFEALTIPPSMVPPAVP